MSTATEQIKELANTEYKYGFVTEVEQDIVPKGLNEDVIRLISAKKGEPEWLLVWRLKKSWRKPVRPESVGTASVGATLAGMEPPEE